MAITLQEFGDKIKAKYPQYSEIDSVELAEKTIAKYPQYESEVMRDLPSTGVTGAIRGGFGRKVGPQFAGGVASRLAGIVPKTLGFFSGLAGKAAEQRAQARTRFMGATVPKEVTTPVKSDVTKGAEIMKGFGERLEQKTKEKLQDIGIKTDTPAAKVGEVIGGVAPSVLLTRQIGGVGPSFPGIRAGAKPLADFIVRRGAIGLGEELLYNIGTEGEIIRKDGTPDLIIGPLAEIVIPAGIDAVLKKFPIDNDALVKTLKEQVKKGTKTEQEAALELMQRSRKFPSVESVSDDIVNEATKNPDLLKKYYTTVEASNLDARAPTALSEAAKKGDEAFDIVKKKLRDTGTEIGNFKNTVSNVDLGIDGVRKLEDSFNNAISKLNLELVEGTVKKAKGAVTAAVSDGDIKSLQKLYDEGLKIVKQSPKMSNFFEYLDAIRKNAKFATRLGGTATDELKRLARELSGEARNIGRQTMSKPQQKLFDEYSSLIEFMGEFDKKAGTDAKMGLLLRRATSAKGFEGAEMLKTIEKYTGIDLTNHAHLARIATELMGTSDAQKTLLQSTIKNAGIETGNAILDAASGSPLRGLGRLVSRLRPKKDPAKVLLRIAQKYDSAIGYEDAVKLVREVKDAGYKGVGKVPDVTINIDFAKKTISETVDGAPVVAKIKGFDVIDRGLGGGLVLTKDGEEFGHLMYSLGKDAVEQYPNLVGVKTIRVSEPLRRQGVATELFRTALNNLPEGKTGIVGISDEIIPESRGIIDKIFKRLGATKDELGNRVLLTNS